MKAGPSVGVFLLVAALAGIVQSAYAEHRWDRDDARVEQYRDGPCRVKEITDYGYYRKVVRCPNGRGKTWRRGDWHRDYRDGPCRIRIDASREVFDKEKVCRTRDRYRD
ncbi:hypothetical protein ID144_23135 [Pseudomonas sp. JM0905a]|uniref:Uncharacterized protein n=1 Tax=Metapseudomonas resinovorans TaxID=53412 RepID=A0ABT4YA73_METRE|nr:MULTISPECIES: hypothetical protein [Pseudomonas]MBD2839941.1 hypothetical protein [Pseudomonas sp. JM0905a]MDA8485522.1 hypothetical protein [Pseudomonas resinovorans]